MANRIQFLIAERATEKLNEVRPEMNKYHEDVSTHLDSFLFELFRAVYRLRTYGPNNIHVHLAVDGAGDAMTEIWIYYDRRVTGGEAFAERAIDDFTKGLDSRGLRPNQFRVLCKLKYGRGGSDFEVHKRDIGVAGGLDVVAGLGTIPVNHPLDCGWFRSLEGNDGLADEELAELYYYD